MHIIDVEKPYGAVVAFGGQTAIKLTKHLEKAGVHDSSEHPADSDRSLQRIASALTQLLERLGIKRPQGRYCHDDGGSACSGGLASDTRC